LDYFSRFGILCHEKSGNPRLQFLQNTEKSAKDNFNSSRGIGVADGHKMLFILPWRRGAVVIASA
jgi:hypothetical protein